MGIKREYHPIFGNKTEIKRFSELKIHFYISNNIINYINELNPKLEGK